MFVFGVCDFLWFLVILDQVLFNVFLRMDSCWEEKKSQKCLGRSPFKTPYYPWDWYTYLC